MLQIFCLHILFQQVFSVRPLLGFNCSLVSCFAAPVTQAGPVVSKLAMHSPECAFRHCFNVGNSDAFSQEYTSGERMFHIPGSQSTVFCLCLLLGESTASDGNLIIIWSVFGARS